MQATKKKATLRMPAGDSRHFTRFPVKISAHVSLVPDSAPGDSLYEVLRPKAYPVIVNDLSATGLYFTAGIHFDLSQQIWITLTLRGQSIPVRAQILRQQAHLQGNKKVFGYGAQFIRSLYAPRAVAAILDYLSHQISLTRPSRMSVSIAQKP